MNPNQIKTKVSKELSSLPKKGVYAVVSSSEDYFQVNQEIIRYLTGRQKMNGVYVSLSKPYEELTRQLQNAKIDTKKLVFIDGAGEGKSTAANCISMEGNKSLTELSLAMTAASNKEQVKFIFFDSVTTLLIYHDLNTAERFIHYFLNKVLNLNLLMIVVSIDEERSKQLLPILSQFCQKIIRI